MNYVTTNANTSDYSNSTCVCFHYNPKEERRKAVGAAYIKGYITLEEANKLAHQDYVKRNECTVINLSDFRDSITISCYESVHNGPETNSTEILFQLLYIKFSGKIDVIDID